MMEIKILQREGSFFGSFVGMLRFGSSNCSKTIPCIHIHTMPDINKDCSIQVSVICQKLEDLSNTEASFFGPQDILTSKTYEDFRGVRKRMRAAF